MEKVLVLYVFHIFNERVDHFIKNAIFKDENVDFIVISNDKNNKINVPSYVKTMFRDNIGFDFGGWSDALLINDLYKNYDKFIFVNSSVMGPYIPSYCREKWTDVYINGLKDNIKLFGSTINTCCNPLRESHVQSYIFSMDKITLEYLIQQHIFSMTYYANNFAEAIYYKEILMSTKILENKWNIGSLFEYYKDVDFTFSDKTPEDYNINFLDDIMYPHHRNKLWNDYQLVFIKGNRCLN
jgi:lipopolysaccharide biosynthesis protein